MYLAGVYAVQRPLIIILTDLLFYGALFCAGTGMDVATVCCVLSALGVLEQVDASTVVSTGHTVKGDAGANMDVVTSLAAGPATTSAGAGVAVVPLKLENPESSACPESISGPGAELYALLTERWQPRLMEYFEDALKSKQAAAAAEHSAQAEGTAAPTSASTAGSGGGAAFSGPLTAPTTTAPALSSSSGPVATPTAQSSSKTSIPVPSNAHNLQVSSIPPTSAASSATPAPPAPAAQYYPMFTSTLNNAARSAEISAPSGTMPALSATNVVPGSTQVPTAVPTVSSSSSTSASRTATLAPAELSAVSALVGLDSLPRSHHNSNTGGTVVPGGSTASAAPTPGAPALPIPYAGAGTGMLRPTLSSGMVSDLNGSYQPGMRPLPSAHPPAPNSFLSASANSATGASIAPVVGGGSVPYPSGASALPVPAPPVHIVPPYAPPHALPGQPAEVTYTSILSQSGNSITIPGPGAAAAAYSNPKTVKGKAPKVPKPPGEKKQTKRPISKGSELASAMAAAAAGANISAGSSAAPSVVGGANAGVAGGGAAVSAAKTRRGPTALRVWRIREEMLSHAAELLAPLGMPAPALATASTSSSGSAGPLAAKGSHSTTANNQQSGAGTDSVSHSNNQTNSATGNSGSNNSNGSKINSQSSGGGGQQSNPALKLLTQPGLIQSAAQADYVLQSALEIEERLLRRLAGQCNIPLKPSRYRMGTAYLSSEPDIMTQVIGSRYARGSTGAQPLSSYYSKSSAKIPVPGDLHGGDASVGESAVSNAVTEPSFALYDEGVSMTSAYLLDKVRRTKRQRGDCLYGSITLPYSAATNASVAAARSAAAASVGVYSGAHVHALSAVCTKSAEYYWSSGGGQGGSNSPRGTKGAKKLPPAAKSQNEPITMGQYAHNLHMGIHAGGAPVVLSSCNNGSGISAQTLRRYAQPLNLVGGNLPMLDPAKSATMFAATGNKHATEVLRIPDLSLSTREMAWSEIAKEFAVLPAPVDEPGHIAGSTSTATLNNSGDTGHDPVTPGKPPAEKKRKYLQNHGPTPAATSTATLQDAAQRLASIEVLAPQYTEVVPMCEVVRQIKVLSHF
jgi:hypothetical protein